MHRELVANCSKVFLNIFIKLPRELICLLSFTCNYEVFVWGGFLFLWVLGMGYVILLWHSLSLPYYYYGIHFCATKSSQNNESPSHRMRRETVANPSPTLRRRSQTHRNLVSAICTCDKYAIQMRLYCDINKTISRLNCEKIKLIEMRTDIVRHSRECRTTVVRRTQRRETLARMSNDCRETLARMSHDCRANVFNIVACLS